MSDSRTHARRTVPAVVLVLVLAVVGALAGLISAGVRGTTWTSEAQLNWDPSALASITANYADPDNDAFNRQVADQEALVLSDAVIGRVASAVDESATTVRKQVAVETTVGSATFTISATAPTAAQAQAIATATTTEYLSALRAENSAVLTQRIAGLRSAITELRRQLSAGPATLAGALAGNIADLTTQLSAYTVAAAGTVPVQADVTQTATAPTAPSSLSAIVQMLIGAVLGIVVAVCILLLLGSLPSRRQDALPVQLRREPATAIAAPASPASGTSSVPAAPASTGGHLDVVDDGGRTAATSASATS